MGAGWSADAFDFVDKEACRSIALCLSPRLADPLTHRSCIHPKISVRTTNSTSPLLPDTRWPIDNVVTAYQRLEDGAAGDVPIVINRRTFFEVSLSVLRAPRAVSI